MNVRKFLRVCLCFGLIFPAWSLGAAEPYILYEPAPEVSWNDSFGTVLDMDGRTLVVGARQAEIDGNRDQGAAYVYVRRGKEWVNTARLTATDEDGWGMFGSAVAIQGNRIVIGAPRAAANGLSYIGAVYVFERKGQEWVRTARLLAGDPTAFAEFGGVVDLDGDRIVVGARRATGLGIPNAGAAYVFEYDGGRNEWVQTAKLEEYFPVSYASYGDDVAISGDTIAVGTLSFSVDGSVFVYRRDESGWQRTQVLEAVTPWATQLGYHIHIDGNTMLVSAPYDTVGDTPYRAGAIHIYERESSDAPWQRTQSLTEPVPAGYLGFSGITAYGDGYVVAKNRQSTETFYLYAKDKVNGWAHIGELVAKQEISGSMRNGVALSRSTLAFGGVEQISPTESLNLVYIYDFKDVLKELR